MDFDDYDEEYQFCDDCGINPATIRLTHVESGATQTFHLCEDCARQRGLPLPDGDALIRGLEAAIAGAAGAALADTQVKVTVKQGKEPPVEAPAEPVEEDVKCPGCGMKLSEFRANGWLGCADCYGSFEARIGKMLLQIHGAGGHKGKRYGKAPARRGGKRNVERLRRELDEAVRREEFERAAEIRDVIRGIGAGRGAK